jgi:hypothetical protein
MKTIQFRLPPERGATGVLICMKFAVPAIDVRLSGHQWFITIPHDTPSGAIRELDIIGAERIQEPT